MPAHIAPGDGSDVYSVDVGNPPNGITGMRFDAQGRRRVGLTTAPAKAAGAGAGASPTLTLVGTDEHGILTVATGGSGVAAGTLATLTFTTPYATAPASVIISPNDSATAALNPYGSATTTALTIGVQVAPTISTTYKFNYQVVGGA